VKDLSWNFGVRRLAAAFPPAVPCVQQPLSTKPEFRWFAGTTYGLPSLGAVLPGEEGLPASKIPLASDE